MNNEEIEDKQEDNRDAYPDGKLKEFSDEYLDEVSDDGEEIKPRKQTYEEFVEEQLRIEKKLSR